MRSGSHCDCWRIRNLDTIWTNRWLCQQSHAHCPRQLSSRGRSTSTVLSVWCPWGSYRKQWLYKAAVSAELSSVIESPRCGPWNNKSKTEKKSNKIRASLLISHFLSEGSSNIWQERVALCLLHQRPRWDTFGRWCSGSIPYAAFNVLQYLYQ